MAHYQTQYGAACGLKNATVSNELRYITCAQCRTIFKRDYDIQQPKKLESLKSQYEIDEIEEQSKREMQIIKMLEDL